MISGNPVRSDTGRASIAASERVCSVLPVAKSSKPSRRRPREKPASPVLSLTDSRALGNPRLHQTYRGWEQTVPDLVHSLTKCFDRVSGQDLDRFLRQDRPGVKRVGDDSHDVEATLDQVAEVGALTRNADPQVHRGPRKIADFVG